MHIPLATCAGRKIKLQIGVTAGGLADVLDRSVSQRSAAKIGVQDHAGGIDHANAESI